MKDHREKRNNAGYRWRPAPLLRVFTAALLLYSAAALAPSALTPVALTPVHGQNTNTGNARSRMSVPEQIDLDTAVALALQSNLGIESELIALRQNKLIADTWWNRFYPSANASYSLGRWNSEQTASTLVPVPESFDPATGSFGVRPLSVDQPRWFMQAGINLSLDLTLQTFPGYSLAQLQYEMGLVSLAEARRQVEREVSKLFYDLLLTRERIALAEERIANAQRRYNQARINFENGLVDEFSLLSAQVALENQRPGIAALRVAQEQLLLAFRNSLGLPLMTAVEPRGSIDPPALAITPGRELLRDRLDVQQLEMLNRIRGEEMRAGEFGQGGRAPFVRFGLNFDPTFGGDPWGDNWLDGDSWNQRNGALSITLVQPLDAWLPYSRQRNEVERLESELSRNRLQVEQIMRGAEIRVRGLILGIESSQQTVRALEENIRLARRAFELAEIGYDNGLRELLEVQNAEVDLKDAEFQLLQEKKNIMDSILDLAFELNAQVEDITTRSGR